MANRFEQVMKLSATRSPSLSRNDPTAGGRQCLPEKRP